jgi:hypothetical protein
MGYLQYVVVLAILGAIAWFVWRRIVLVRLHPEDADPDLVPPDLIDDVEEIHRREALEAAAGDTGSGTDSGQPGTA